MYLTMQMECMVGAPNPGNNPQRLQGQQVRNIRAGNMGELIVSHLHGRYYENTYRKNMFTARTTAGVNPTGITSGSTTIITGLILSNPILSSVNLVVNKVEYALSGTQGANPVVIIGGVAYNNTNVTHSSPLTVRSLYPITTQNVGLVDSSSTLPTAPNFTHMFGMIPSTPLASSKIPTVVDLEGSVILPPGGAFVLGCNFTIGSSVFWPGIIWTEVPR